MTWTDAEIEQASEILILIGELKIEMDRKDHLRYVSTWLAISVFINYTGDAGIREDEILSWLKVKREVFGL